MLYVIVVEIPPVTDQEINKAIDRVLLTEGVLDSRMLCSLVMRELGCDDPSMSPRVLELAVQRVTERFNPRFAPPKEYPSNYADPI